MKKKVIIGAIVAALVIIAIIICAIAISQSESGSKKKKKNDYSKIAEDFIVALKSEENMEEFAEENMDFKALYAYDSEELAAAESIEEYNELFKKIRDNAAEEDFEEMKDMYIGGYKELASYGLELELKDTKVENPKDYPDFTIFDAIYDEDGEKVSFTFYLYKGKPFMILRGEGLDYVFSDEGYYSGDEDIKVNLTNSEKRKLNKKIGTQLDKSENRNGADISDIIDAIIEVDEEYMEKGVFVALYLHLDGVNTNDLIMASSDAEDERTVESIKAAVEEMKKIKSYLNKDEYYSVTISTNHGIYKSISIEPYEENN